MEQILPFVGATFLITIAPGPDIIFTITQGITRGLKSALLTALGLALGNTIHITAATLGLSLILSRKPALFAIIKIAGALYLFYLGWKSLKNINSPENEFKQDQNDIPWYSSVARGFIMNVLNPKVSLFFIAFLPQFIVDNGDTTKQFLLLGGIFIIMVVVIFGSAGALASVAGRRIIPKGSSRKILKGGAAVIYGALGIKLLLSW